MNNLPGGIFKRCHHHFSIITSDIQRKQTDIKHLLITYPPTSSFDAACVGVSYESVVVKNGKRLLTMSSDWNIQRQQLAIPQYQSIAL